MKFCPVELRSFDHNLSVLRSFGSFVELISEWLRGFTLRHIVLTPLIVTVAKPQPWRRVASVCISSNWLSAGIQSADFCIKSKHMQTFLRADCTFVTLGWARNVQSTSVCGGKSAVRRSELPRIVELCNRRAPAPECGGHLLTVWTMSPSQQVPPPVYGQRGWTRRVVTLRNVLFSCWRQSLCGCLCSCRSSYNRRN